MRSYVHYITVGYITFTALHYITLHYITLHYITLHYITLHYITSHITCNLDPPAATRSQRRNPFSCSALACLVDLHLRFSFDTSYHPVRSCLSGLYYRAQHRKQLVLCGVLYSCPLLDCADVSCSLSHGQTAAQRTLETVMTTEF